MTQESWWTIKVICGGIAGVFALLAALFALLDVIHGYRQGKVKAWFRAKWEAVGRSPWLNMPEHVIRFFVIRMKRWAARVPVAIFERRRMGLPLVVAGPVAIIAARYYLANATPAMLSAIMCMACFFAGCGVLYVILKLIAGRPPNPISLPERLGNIFGSLGAATFVAMFVFLVTAGMLVMPLAYAVPATVVVSPLYWLILWLGLSEVLCLVRRKDKLEGRQSDLLLALCVGTGLSFAVTLAAILIGHVASPVAWVPQTPQMLISNVVFDGLTMVATLLILRRALAHPTLWRIVLAVVVDVVVAAALACLSLLVGLVFTSKALSVDEILNVLVGLSPDGSHAEVAPYFWAMHTTFLPTLAYLGVILAACMGKALLIPVRWFFGVGYEKGPLRLTAALFALFAALFWLPTYGAGVAEEKAKKTPTTHKATSIPAAPPELGPRPRTAPNTGATFFRIPQAGEEALLAPKAGDRIGAEMAQRQVLPGAGSG